MRCLALLLGCALALASAAPAQAQDSEAVAKVRDLNKKAVDAYENLELEEARKFLMEALEMCAAEGLNRHAIKATTHLNLGVVLVGGLKQRDAGTKQFRRALEIDPNLKVPKRLINPEIQAAFDAAAKAGGEAEPATKPPAPPPAETGQVDLTVAHDPVAEAAVGGDIEIRSKVQGGNNRLDKLVLAYRAEGASDFLARDMEKQADGAYVAEIPGSAAAGASVAYYLEARGRGGQALGRNGTPDVPHVIALAGGAPIDLAAEAEPGGRGAKAPKPGARTWLSLGLGVGGGWAKGHPEVNPNYIDDGTKQKRSIEFANVAAAKLLHFNPELGYFLTPRVLLSLQGRLQLVTGASETRHDSCTPNKVCQPASGAVAVVAKGAYLLEPKGRLQPYAALSAGGGYIRYLVDISSFRLSGCGNDDGSNCFDTVASGGLLVGPSAGAWVHLTGPVYLTGQLGLLLGVPKFAINADLNLGLGYRM